MHRLAFFVEHFAGRAKIDVAWWIAQSQNFVFGGYRRDRDHFPGLTFEIEEAADQILHMQALHDDDDRAVLFVIEAGAERAAIELPNLAPFRLPQGIEGLDRIIDHDEIGTAAKDRPTDPRGIAVSVLACHEFMVA